jgi:glycine/D-amino acid oxidase-like deaminating enzyme
VVGECLADLVLGRRPELDLSPLSLDRFSQQALRPEAHVA